MSNVLYVNELERRNGILETKLAESQAREAKLLEGLRCLLATAQTLEGVKAGCATLTLYPKNDTALKERLKTERERCAKACDARRRTVSNGNGLSMFSHDPASVEAAYCADTIRNLGDEP